MTEKEIQDAIKNKTTVYYVEDDDEYFYEDIPVKEADIRKVYIQHQKYIDDIKVYVGKYDGIKTPNEAIWVKPKSELYLTYEEAYQESLKRFIEYVSDLRIRYEKIGNALSICEKRLSNIKQL